jgi:hypothetical protein
LAYSLLKKDPNKIKTTDRRKEKEQPSQQGEGEAKPVPEPIPALASAPGPTPALIFAPEPLTDNRPVEGEGEN